MKVKLSEKVGSQSSSVTTTKNHLSTKSNQPCDPSRRSFLSKAGGAGVAVMAAGALGLEPIIAAGIVTVEQPSDTKPLTSRRKPSQANTDVFVRQDSATLTNRQIDAYARGVRVMKSRPVTDPTSWLYQANMHGTTDTPELALWNTCQHGNFFFPSWHRMYLYWFERIVRAASGDPDFTLPYWNWSNATTRAIPLAFRRPAERNNPLFVAARNPDINEGGLLPFSAVQIWQAFGFENFTSEPGSGQSFAGQFVDAPVHLGSPHGQLESRPHDIVHLLIGGDTGWMSDPKLAARDPIFWFHHSNMDRLWDRWLNLNQGRMNSDSETWLDTPFNFFDENGNQVTQIGREIVDTAAQLNYVYDDDPGPLPLPPPVGPTPAATIQSQATEVQTLGVSTQTPVVLNGRTVRVNIAVPGEARSRLIDAARGSGNSSLLLNLDDIQFERAPGVFYEIYLNLPDGDRADARGPHFAGTLAVFGMKVHHGEGSHEPIKQTVDLRGSATALQARGKWGEGDVTVTFVPRGLDPPPGRSAVSRTTRNTIKIGKVWISSN